MSTFVRGADIGEAWLNAFDHLNGAPSRRLVNLAVTIENPLAEDLGIRSVLDATVGQFRRAGKAGAWQSVHTVANTVFPISLYNPGAPSAAERFFKAATAVSRKHENRGTEWGTYIGRLLSYRLPSGEEINQIGQFLKRLNESKVNWSDVYEAPLTYAGEGEVPLENEVGDLHLIGPTDKRLRGGPCLAHISLTQLDGRLHLTAMYRRHHYVARAYGNFLGLARLLNFLATESGNEVGEILVLGTHAEIEDLTRSQREELLLKAREAKGDVRDIELTDRPLGSNWRDLDLPLAPT